ITNSTDDAEISGNNTVFITYEDSTLDTTFGNNEAIQIDGSTNDVVFLGKIIGISPTETYDATDDIILNTVGGNFSNMLIANAETVYVIAEEMVLGGKTKIFINAATEPTLSHVSADI